MIFKFAFILIIINIYIYIGWAWTFEIFSTRNIAAEKSNSADMDENKNCYVMHTYH